MVPYSRLKRSDLHTLSWSKLLKNHTLHSGTYLYSPYMAVSPPRNTGHMVSMGMSKKRDSSNTITELHLLIYVGPRLPWLFARPQRMPSHIASFDSRHRRPKLRLRGKGVMYLHTIGNAPVSHYRRPLKYKRLCIRNILLRSANAK